MKVVFTAGGSAELFRDETLKYFSEKRNNAAEREDRTTGIQKKLVHEQYLTFSQVCEFLKSVQFE